MRIAHGDLEARWPQIAGGRHVDVLVGTKYDRAENAADRLGETIRSILRRRARVGIAAIPGRSTAQLVRGEPVDRKCGEQARHCHEDKHQQPVVGATTFHDRYDREPFEPRLDRHAVADQAFDDRRQRIDEEARQDSCDEAQGREEEHRGERPSVGLPRALGGSRAGTPKECDAERLDEAGGRKGRRECQHGADGGHQELQTPRRKLWAQQDGLEGQPFRDEAVERWQRRDGSAADKERERCLRHPMDEAAEMLHVALAGRGEHRPRTEEQ